MRVFLDTNVLVSAFGTRGLCADVLREVMTAHKLVVGEVVLEELEGALVRAFDLPRDVISAAERLLRAHEVVPRPSQVPDVELADPDDLWILASALAGGADVLVTGDRELLKHESVGPVRIVSPRGLWELLRRR